MARWRPMAAVLAIVGGVACGRIGYDPDPTRHDGSAVTDGATDASGGVQPIHQYRFDGNYLDDFGGPSLVPRGGALLPGAYRFGPDQGLSLTGAVPPTEYTIDLLFSFDNLASWRKIVDVDDLATDTGFYTFDDALQYVIVAGQTFATSSPRFTLGTLAQVTLTRASTGATAGLVDRAAAFDFVDTGGVSDLPAMTGVVHFFVDDRVTGGGEAPAGVVRRIRIYDRALGPDELPP